MSQPTPESQEVERAREWRKVNYVKYWEYDSAAGRSFHKADEMLAAYHAHASAEETRWWSW